MTTLMRNGRDRRSGKPAKCHATNKRVFLVGSRSADYISQRPERLHKKAVYMAAPNPFAEMPNSSCNAGVVHTWHFLILARSTHFQLHAKTGPTAHDAFEPKQPFRASDEVPRRSERPPRIVCGGRRLRIRRLAHAPSRSFESACENRLGCAGVVRRMCGMSRKEDTS